MSARFPKFRPGMKHGDLSALDLQHLSDAARASLFLSGTGVEIRQSLGSGTHIRVTPQRPRRAVPSDSNVVIVAVTVKPLDADKTLTVREVAYKDGSKGPTADTDRPYEFDGDPIADALPFPGRRAKDYAGKELTTLVSGSLVPTPTDHYFVAAKFGDVTIVGDIAESGTQSARFRVVGVGPDTVIADMVKDDGSIDTSNKNVSIARPWELRRTPFDGKLYKGSKYVYTFSLDLETTRYRTSDVIPTPLTEREVVYPTYGVGDEIYATKIGKASGVPDVVWLDDNRGARRWARSTQQ